MELLPNEFVLYRSRHGAKLSLMKGKNLIVATNRRLLIFSRKGYKSIFYDKVVSLDVSHGLSVSYLKIKLMAGDAEVVKLKRSKAYNLFGVISNITSVNKDVALAYSNGILDTKSAMSTSARDAQEMPEMQELMHARKGYDASVAEPHADAQSRKPYSSMPPVNFNFIKSEDDTEQSNIDSLRDISRHIYNNSAMLFNMAYKTAKVTTRFTAGKSAELLTILNEKLKQIDASAGQAMSIRYVSLADIARQVELGQDPELFLLHVAFLDALSSGAYYQSYQDNSYSDLGKKLVGVNRVNPFHEAVVESEKKVLNQKKRTTEYEQAQAVYEDSSLLRRESEEPAYLKEKQQEAQMSKEPQMPTKYDPDMGLLVFRIRKRREIPTAKKSSFFAALHMP